MPIKIYSPLGVKLDVPSSTPDAALGDEARGEANSKWLYVLAGEAITQYAAVGVNYNFTANLLTKVHADAGRKIGVAQVAFASGQYGWVATQGGNNILAVRAKNACQPNVALYTTATAGYLDDTSATQTLVNGIVLTDTATASGAAKPAFIMTEVFPTPAP